MEDSSTEGSGKRFHTASSEEEEGSKSRKTIQEDNIIRWECTDLKLSEYNPVDVARAIRSVTGAVKKVIPQKNGAVKTITSSKEDAEKLLKFKKIHGKGLQTSRVVRRKG